MKHLSGQTLHRPYARRAFSLIEMAMVVAISGFMLSFILKANQSTTKDCYPETRQQMQTIRTAIENFAHANDRLPMPANRLLGVEDPMYGHEAIAANVTVVGASSWGAVPFQALGLSPAYGADCWGNKYTYVVTTALTTNASSGGYLDSSVKGAISLESSVGTTISTTNAYAIISHGEDGLGAVKANATAGGWCAGATLKSINCSAAAAMVADTTFNDGANAGANYYDDLILTAGKVSSALTNLYCWGTDLDGYGTLADGSAVPGHHYYTPTRAKSTLTFTSLTNAENTLSIYTPCALTADGTAYCWGLNSGASNSGAVGDGTTTNRAVPTKVSTALKFTQIFSNGSGVNCGLIADGTAYCWGLGYGTTPAAVPTAQKFTKLAINLYGGYWSNPPGMCGLTAAGDTYCWGACTNSMVCQGRGYQTVSSMTPTLINGGRKFADIRSAAGGNVVCGLTNASDPNPAGAGQIYCWGGSSLGYGWGPNLELIPGFGLAPISITGISNANPGVVTTALPHTLSAGDIVALRDTHGMGSLNYQEVYVVSVISPTSFSIGRVTDGRVTPGSPQRYSTNFDTTAAGTYSGGGEMLLMERATAGLMAGGPGGFTSLGTVADGYSYGSISAVGSDGKIYTLGQNGARQIGDNGATLAVAPYHYYPFISNATTGTTTTLTTSPAHGLHNGDVFFIGTTPTLDAWLAGLHIAANVTATTLQVKNLDYTDLDSSADTWDGSWGPSWGPEIAPFSTSTCNLQDAASAIDGCSYTFTPAAGSSNYRLATVANLVNSGSINAAGGGVDTWGIAYYGGVGDGSGNGSYSPVHIPVPANFKVAKFIAADYTVMALSTDNRLYGWHSNLEGRLATGNTTNPTLPVNISGSIGGVIDAINLDTGNGTDGFCALGGTGAIPNLPFSTVPQP